MVNYSYFADGTKVSALDSEGDGLVYLGSLIYRKTGNAIELESAGFAGGMFVAKDAAAGGKEGQSVTLTTAPVSTTWLSEDGLLRILSRRSTTVYRRMRYVMIIR